MKLSRVLAGLLIAGSAAAAGAYHAHRREAAPDPAPTAAPAHPADTPAAGVGLFAGWPAEPPAVAFLLSGQTFGYLSPCGCSSPQKGGLERRANLVAKLRDKGWEVVGLDLGDVAPPKGVPRQNLLKYRTALKAMGGMGYAAVGLGETEFKGGLFELLAEYTLNNPGKPPTVLADNLVGAAPPGGAGPVPRKALFPGGAGGRALVEGVEVVARPGRPAVGVVAVVGPETADAVGKADPQFAFLSNADVLAAAVKQLDAHPAKPALRVLLYNGPLAQAKAAAGMFPGFQLVLCQSDDPEPPDLPIPASGGKTQVVQVGHKGQNVGVVGAYPAAGGWTLRYQRVPLTEEFVTSAGEAAEKGSDALRLMQEYADEVKRIDSLKLHRANPRPHQAQVLAPDADLRYVGTDACKACHPAEWQQHEQTKHSHAYAALEEAKRPSGRQFDGECIICHTVGFEHPTGFENADSTPQLKNVGCESCHGPGSGHAAKPHDPQLLALQSPWKTQPADRLPDLAFIKDMAGRKPFERGQVAIQPEQMQVVTRVATLCMKCHDPENDPHFNEWEYLPKIWHSGMPKVAAGQPAKK